MEIKIQSVITGSTLWPIIRVPNHLYSEYGLPGFIHQWLKILPCNHEKRMMRSGKGEEWLDVALRIVLLRNRLPCLPSNTFLHAHTHIAYTDVFVVFFSFSFCALLFLSLLSSPLLFDGQWWASVIYADLRATHLCSCKLIWLRRLAGHHQSSRSIMLMVLMSRP